MRLGAGAPTLWPPRDQMSPAIYLVIRSCILVAGPEEGMTIALVAERTEVPGLPMQRSFGRATIWIRNRIDE
jgi:hypothetical protein